MYALKNHRQRRLNGENGFNRRRAFRGFVLDDWPVNCDNAIRDRVNFGCYTELGSPDGPARFRVSIRVKQMSTRRSFLKSTLGTAAFASLLQRDGFASTGTTHFTPTAKRVVYLFQSGGPSQLELFDEKPALRRLHGTELPDSIRQGQRLTGMTSGQASFPVIAPKFGFHSCGQSGTRISNLLPHTGSVVDDICIVKSMFTEAINHDPAITFIQT